MFSSLFPLISKALIWLVHVYNGYDEYCTDDGNEFWSVHTENHKIV